jgi:hypothetical protein
MSDDNTRDAAEPSLASAGSQPVAWEVFLPGVGTYDILSFRWEAEAIANGLREREGTKALALPLCRQPQPALTDEECKALEVARDILGEMEDDNGDPFTTDVGAISGLLERLK